MHTILKRVWVCCIVSCRDAESYSVGRQSHADSCDDEPKLEVVLPVCGVVFEAYFENLFDLPVQAPQVSISQNEHYDRIDNQEEVRELAMHDQPEIDHCQEEDRQEIHEEEWDEDLTPHE